MTCSQCKGIEEVFDQKEAARELKKYRKKGPSKTTRMLIEAIEEHGVEGRTLLDIGGGVGAIQHELVRAGVATASGVDASSAYLEAAQDEAKRQGHGDRVGFRHGNFVDVAEELGQADIVTLDKVICCYHDVEQLVGLSAGLAARLYGVVYPHDNWAFRLVARLANLYLRLRRRSFRGYVHPSSTVDTLIRSKGLQQRSCRKTLIWQVVVYAR